ncbi:hypothetical protein BDZ97DRAFT_2065250 [Flammula alnicola]|nr:hypothetical protein BDZ97DRAFT_2065250 [Flammula alnicola]
MDICLVPTGTAGPLQQKSDEKAESVGQGGETLLINATAQLGRDKASPDSREPPIHILSNKIAWMGREAHAACTSDKMTFESRTSRNVGSMHCYFRDEQPLAAAPLPKHTINNNTLYVICNRDEDEDEAGPVRMYRLCEATYLATSTLLPLSHFTPPVKDEACPAQQQPCSHRERCHESLCDPDSSTRTATPPWLDPTSQAQHDPSAADGTCTGFRREGYGFKIFTRGLPESFTNVVDLQHAINEGMNMVERLMKDVPLMPGVAVTHFIHL